MMKDSSKETTEDRLASRVRDILEKSGNCAQTSFAVLQEEFDLDGNQVLRALTPFPGIALRGETCGAVIGCLMALGLEFGRDDLDDWRGYIRSLPSARRFCMSFEEENGSTACSSILIKKLGRNYDLADRAEAQEYASVGGPQVCSELIIRAVKIAAETIRKNRKS